MLSMEAALDDQVQSRSHIPQPTNVYRLECVTYCLGVLHWKMRATAPGICVSHAKGIIFVFSFASSFIQLFMLPHLVGVVSAGLSLQLGLFGAEAALANQVQVEVDDLRKDHVLRVLKHHVAQAGGRPEPAKIGT